MISFLSGTIKNKNSKTITLDVNGVGYEIAMTQPVLEKIKVNDKKEIFCYLYVREDALDLYGFNLPEEKKFFELLISISGVGPKSALQTLAIAKLSEIKQAVLRGDPTLLRKVSGIGQKTAERIVIELRNKLDDLPVGDEKINLSASGSEAFDALQGLGYSASEVRTALRQVSPEIDDEDEIIKSALKLLGRDKK